MYCSKCGKENPNDAKYCSACGSALTNSSEDELAWQRKENTVAESTAKTTPVHSYLKYCDNVKKITLLTLLSQILSVLMVIALLFMPIYLCKYEADINDIESLDQFTEAIQNDGKISKNFSLFDDIMKISKVFFTDGESDSFDTLIFLYYALFPLFEIVFSIILICTIVPKIWGAYNDLRNVKNTTMLKYNEMKLTGTKQSKQSIFKQQAIVTIILYAVMDIIFTMTFGPLISKVSDTLPVSMVRYMEGFAGFSSWGIFIVAMLVVFIIAQSTAKKEEKTMLMNVTEEQYR